MVRQTGLDPDMYSISKTQKKGNPSRLAPSPPPLSPAVAPRHHPDARLTSPAAQRRSHVNAPTVAPVGRSELPLRIFPPWMLVACASALVSLQYEVCGLLGYRSSPPTI